MTLFDSVMAFLQSLQGLPAYALLFAVLVGSGFGLPMNEDILLLVAAALTLKGVMEPLPLIAVAWAGLVIADLLIFHWGRVFGSRLLEHRAAARLMPPERLAATQRTMQRWGPATIFMARFMPGVRTAVYFAAGSLKMHYRQQVLFDGAAAAIELPLLVYGVRYLGGRWEQILEQLQRFQAVLVPAMVLLAAAAWLYLRRRGRR
ncbi:MAG TPA: DedA family protein [Ramlibacter sp.]|nr:DedA family protein [Ramlibacter sp.]